MATYAIGDIQGCFDSLLRLLDYIQFNRRADRLWLVGDLVNRGPRSLDVLRWARDLGDAAVIVLGNHDIHLLARAAGVARRKKRDTLEEALDAPDAPELIDWLRARSVLHVEGDLAMVHAGLHPDWSIADATGEARSLTALLRASDWRERIGGLAGKKAPTWSPELAPEQRVSAAAAVFFSMRTCRRDGSLCQDFKGPADSAPSDCSPWFKAAGARWTERRVVFGHWSTLGLLQGKYVLGLDTGCVWGGALTACRLEDGQIFQVPAAERNPVPVKGR